MAAEELPFRCFRCGKTPDELVEYIEAAAEWEMTPHDYMLEEEGTVNRAARTFCCTICYVAIGCPSGFLPGEQWIAPPILAAECPK